MTLDEWQRSPELVTWAMKLFSDGNWQLLRQMLDTEHPKNYQKEYNGMSADRELGMIYGYDRLLNNIEQAGKPIAEPVIIEPTYGADTGTSPIEKTKKQRAASNK